MLRADAKLGRARSGPKEKGPLALAALPRKLLQLFDERVNFTHQFQSYRQRHDERTVIPEALFHVPVPFVVPDLERNAQRK